MLKKFERWGRRALIGCVGFILQARQKLILLGAQPTILVLRLDERLGNLLLLTPLLNSLRTSYPQATIDLMLNVRGSALMSSHPSINHVVLFDKRAWFKAWGPLRVIFALRRRHYDVVIDTANPTDPSATQALLTRFAGATYSIGTSNGPFARVYTTPVEIDESTPHEIDLRLQLLTPLPKISATRQTSIGPLPETAIAKFMETLTSGPWAVINVGARLLNKQLGAAQYAQIAELLQSAGLIPVLSYGPKELNLARQVAELRPGSLLAPPTDVPMLATLFRRAICVVSCDTGPMHLAVAVGTPTCGIFVSTDPQRYGYAQAPHCVVDARFVSDSQWIGHIAKWVQSSAQSIHRKTIPSSTASS